MIKQQQALLETEGVQMQFTDAAIREISRVAEEVSLHQPLHTVDLSLAPHCGIFWVSSLTARFRSMHACTYMLLSAVQLVATMSLIMTTALITSATDSINHAHCMLILQTKQHTMT